MDAETGYRVATPYTRVLEINEALGAKIDQSGSFFFAKCIFHIYDEAVKKIMFFFCILWGGLPC